MQSPERIRLVAFITLTLILPFGLFVNPTPLPLAALIIALAILGLVMPWLLQKIDEANPPDDRELAIESEAHYAPLAQGLDIAIFALDNEGRVTYANRRAEGMFRVMEPIGRPAEEFIPSRELSDLVEEARETGMDQQIEVNLLAPVERTVVAKSWRSDDGHMLLAIEDVTEIRRLERIRSDFVANVSHELRTPMATIRAMAETVQDDDDPDLRNRYMERVIREVDRLTAISDDLLVLSVAESQTGERYPFDIDNLVDSVVAELRPNAAEKEIELRYESSDASKIVADEGQIIQVVRNLVENAIKYTHEGHVEVSLEPTEREIVLIVSDTGIGIPEEQLGRIFERFYRVDKGRSRATGGTGLGLAIVRNVVEAHDGKIKVQSEEGRGSTFIVTLPRSPIT